MLIIISRSRYWQRVSLCWNDVIVLHWNVLLRLVPVSSSSLQQSSRRMHSRRHCIQHLVVCCQYVATSATVITRQTWWDSHKLAAVVHAVCTYIQPIHTTDNIDWRYIYWKLAENSGSICYHILVTVMPNVGSVCSKNTIVGTLSLNSWLLHFYTLRRHRAYLPSTTITTKSSRTILAVKLSRCVMSLQHACIYCLCGFKRRSRLAKTAADAITVIACSRIIQISSIDALSVGVGRICFWCCCCWMYRCYANRWPKLA